MISAKLRLMTSYEAIHSRTRFRFRVGALARITPKSLFNFILAYSGYMMVAFQFLQERKNT